MRTPTIRTLMHPLSSGVIPNIIGVFLDSYAKHSNHNLGLANKLF
jgi:hypothetical protein